MFSDVSIDLRERPAPRHFQILAKKPCLLAVDTEYGALMRDCTMEGARMENIKPLSIGWALFDSDGALIDGYPAHYLIKPSLDVAITPGATNINGITRDIANEFGRDSRYVLSLFVRDLIATQMNNGLVVGHSAQGDIVLVLNELYNLAKEDSGSSSSRTWNEAISYLLKSTVCTLEPSRLLQTNGRWMKLGTMFQMLADENLIKTHSHALMNSHNSAWDALMTGYCFFALKNRMKLHPLKRSLFGAPEQVSSELKMFESSISESKIIASTIDAERLGAVQDYAENTWKLFAFRNGSGNLETANGHLLTAIEEEFWFEQKFASGVLSFGEVPKQGPLNHIFILGAVFSPCIHDQVSEKFGAVYDTRIKLWRIDIAKKKYDIGDPNLLELSEKIMQSPGIRAVCVA